MFIKNPVIARILDSRFGIREVVMGVYEANILIKRNQKEYRKIAYRLWLRDTKGMFACIVCGENDPNALHFHHLGEQYTGMPKKRSISSMVTRQLPLAVIEHEMSKCIVLCASCHLKMENGGKEALEDLYDMSERPYGMFYAPGDETQDTKTNRRRFRVALRYLPIDIVAFLNPAYLTKHNKIQQDIEEEEQETSYAKKRDDLSKEIVLY